MSSDMIRNGKRNNWNHIMIWLRTIFEKSSDFLNVTYPLPNLPPRGGPTVKKSALWLILERGQLERRPSRQSGAFAKIACKAIFKRSALPWGKRERGSYRLK